MSATLVADVENQVQTFWSGLFMDELKEATILPSLVNRDDYEGDIKKKGDTVRVSQINRPSANRKTVGSGHESFTTTQLSTSYVDVKADQVISTAYEIDDLVDLQSQIGDQNSKIRKAMLEAIEIEINNYLYSLVAPSAATPDHRITSNDFNAAQLGTVRQLASTAKWSKDGGWWLLNSPQYITDMLNAQTLTSKDYTDDMPVVGGQMANKRFGFYVLEDNSDALLGLDSGGVEAGLAFHPDFLIYVVQKEATFELSSLHSNKKFGYVLSVRLVCGAKLGIDGDKKHIQITGS